LRLVYIHTIHILCMIQCDYIGTMLIHFEKVAAMLI